MTHSDARSTAAIADPFQSRAARERMVAIARNQRQVILLVVLQCLMNALRNEPSTKPGGEALALFVAFANLGFVVALVIVFFRTARVLWGSIILGILFALFGWIPLVNLGLMGILSWRSTSELKGAGFGVGLLGADVRAVEAWARQV